MDLYTISALYANASTSAHVLYNDVFDASDKADYANEYIEALYVAINNGSSIPIINAAFTSAVKHISDASVAAENFTKDAKYLYEATYRYYSNNFGMHNASNAIIKAARIAIAAADYESAAGAISADAIDIVNLLNSVNFDPMSAVNASRAYTFEASDNAADAIDIANLFALVIR